MEFIMSIRSLLATTINSTESAIQGLVSLGSTVGDSTTWLKRQSSKINHQSVIEQEEDEFLASIKERQQALVKRVEKLDADLPEKVEAMKAFLRS